MPLVDPGDGTPPVHYADIAEDCIEPQFVQNAGRLRRVVKLLWDDLERAVRGFVGFAQVKKSNAGVRWIHRHVPDHVPRFMDQTGNPTLFCVSAGPASGMVVRGIQGDDTQGFKYAKLPLEYRTLSWVVKQDNEVIAENGELAGLPDESTLDRYVTPLFETAGKIISLPQGMMRLASAVAADRIPIRQGLPFRRAAGTFHLIHHLLPELPGDVLAQAENRINASAFAGFPAQTLLLSGYKYRRERSPLGDFVYNLELVFDYLPNWSPVSNVAKGHNTILRKLAGVLDYYPVSTDGTLDPAKAPYQLFDMAAVLQPDQT